MRGLPSVEEMVRIVGLINQQMQLMHGAKKEMSKSINDAAEVNKTKVAVVERSGEAIRIPSDMSLSDAIETLQRKAEEEEQVIKMSRDFKAFVWDGCYALAKALDKKFGWFQQMRTPGGFFEPDEPPAMYTVKINTNDTVDVPWGDFRVPGMTRDDGKLSTGYYFNQQLNGMVCFRLNAEMKRKHSLLFNEICKGIEEELLTSSLYKGKAITIKFRDSDGEKMRFPEPSFPKINSLDGDKLIFPRHVESALEANLYTPLTKTAKCRAAGIPLKRGVLLAGPYGTGKTLTAQRTAQLAQENGWTYLFCQSAADFCDCVNFARQYQPAVVFCEDIDRVTDDDRDEQMDEILETIDGVNAKGTEIMLVLTTNEVENIHQGMLRPGRLDAVVIVERPDGEAVQRLLRLYGRDLIPEDEDLSEAGERLAGCTPAVIREVVERSKLTALAIAGDSDTELRLSQTALIHSARTMKDQLELLNREAKRDPHPLELFGRAAAKALVDAINEVGDEHPDAFKSIRSAESNGSRQLTTT